MYMAGGYQTTGERADRGTGSGADTGGGWINGRGDATMMMLEGYAHIVDCFSRLEWWKMEPDDTIVSGGNWCLAEPGRQYLVYLPLGGTTALRIGAGKYEAWRFNPRTGAAEKLGVVIGPEWTTPATPSRDDWAFILRRPEPHQSDPILGTSLDSITSDLDLVIRRYGNSYHELIRAASLVVVPRCKDKSWLAVTTAFAKQGFTITEEVNKGDTNFRHYLAKMNAYRAPGGQGHDLVITIAAKNRDGSQELLVHQRKVRQASCPLVVTIEKPFANAEPERWCPKGSVLEAVFAHPQTRAACTEWPIVRRVFVSYGLLYNRWQEWHPSGFQITVEFVASRNKEVGGATMYFTAKSRLDPLKTLDGKALHTDRFLPQDFLGLVETAGGWEWHQKRH